MRAYDGDSNLDYMSERPFFGDRGIPDMGNTCQSVSGKKEHSGVQLKKIIKSALQPSLAKGTGASGWRQGGRARSMFMILDFIQYFGGVVVEGRWMIRSAFFKDCLAAVQRLEWRGGRGWCQGGRSSQGIRQCKDSEVAQGYRVFSRAQWCWQDQREDEETKKTDKTQT